MNQYYSIVQPAILRNRSGFSRRSRLNGWFLGLTAPR